MSANWLSPFPDPTHVLLLRAGLEDGEAARAAFAEWSARVDLREPVDEATFRLLPQVYHNLSRLGCSDRQMPLLKGVYRHSWAGTQLRLERAAKVVSIIAGAGIPVMASKGLALVQGYYASPALRPMSDIDLYVPQPQVRAAVRALEAAGWAADAEWHRDPAYVMIRWPATTLRDGLGNEVDLHWEVLSECQMQACNDRFWAHAESFQFLGNELKRPNATHLLLHVVAHGMRYNLFSPVRWINDAAMILRRTDQPIDWEELYDFARRARVSHRVALGMSYLRETMGFDVRVPAQMPSPTLVERIENRFFLRNQAEGSQGAFYRSVIMSYLARFLSGDRRRHFPLIIWRGLSNAVRGPAVPG